jgi:hypothetical protein
MSFCGKIISKLASLHYLFRCVLPVFMLLLTHNAFCQYQNPAKDSVTHTLRNDSSAAKSTSINDSTNRKDSIVLNKDSLIHHLDTTAKNAKKTSQLEDSLGIKISKDALPDVVKAIAQDSAVLDIKNNLFYLYGKAQVNYEDMQLNAGKIFFAQSSNMVTAQPLYDTAGVIVGEQPTFAQGKEKFTYDSMQYNFKSKRAIVRNVHSQYGEGYVQSQQVKRNPDQSIYGLHSVYTTCALDTPHFGIVARKIKVIPGKVIASGPANLFIEGVPTPLFIPFGLFPISQSQHSGFVLPTYTIEQARGLGLLNGGYYFAISDYVDLLAQTNIYTKGSYSVSGLSDYFNRYHYTGSLSVSYAYNKTGQDYEPGASITKDFMVVWRHQSDTKAIPGQTFNASVQAGTSSFYSNNSYDPNQILQNQYQSNITYSKTWQGKPFNLTVSALHSQNTATKEVDVTLPSINFHVTQINPFQSKTSVGTHWYDKITASYTFDLEDQLKFYDTSFHFNKLGLGDLRNGIHQQVPISASYTILRFINMSFNINYDEFWLTDRSYQYYNSSTEKIDTFDTKGFYTARDFNAGVTFSTRIYGMKLFKHGKLRGIRHVLTPTVGFSYNPDFGASPFNYYYRTHLDSSSAFYYLSPYQSSIVGVPPQGKAAMIPIGLNNNLQIKVRSSKDTVTGYKNVTLIDGLSINTAYNAAVDSFNWSNIAIAFRTNVLDKINISGSANFDPYAYDYQDGIRTKTLMLDNGTGIARFTNATLAVGTNFHSKPAGNKQDPSNSEEYNRLMRNNAYRDYVDFNVPWSFNVSYALSANSLYSYYSKSDTFTITHSAMFSGEVKITDRWRVTFNSGYDFNSKQLTLTTIDLYRDLHCWMMHLQTIPFGPRKSFNFTLNVKATVLQDLKLTRRRDYRDAAQ